jgi:hypothetical protein
MSISNVLSFVEIALSVTFAIYVISSFNIFYIVSKSHKAFMLYDPKPFYRISFFKLNTIYSLLKDEEDKRKMKVLMKYYFFHVCLLYGFYALVFIFIILSISKS